LDLRPCPGPGRPLSPKKTVSYSLPGLSRASSVLVVAVFAPTNPVLARGVQVSPSNIPDKNNVKFSLTAEAGMKQKEKHAVALLETKGLGLFFYLSLALAEEILSEPDVLWSRKLTDTLLLLHLPMFL